VFHDSLLANIEAKCVKWYKLIKYYHETCLKCQINLTKFG